jgi:hypothetical protein
MAVLEVKTMGEYILHNGDYLKIGTCETLHYVTYFDMVRLAQSPLTKTAPANSRIYDYLEERYGWHYRFPFPDEDETPIEDKGWNRGWTVSTPKEWQESHKDFLFGTLEIVSQKLVNGRLQVIIRPSQFKLFRLDTEDAATLATLMLKEAKTDNDFAMVARLVSGYMDDVSIELLEDETQ